MGQFWNLLGLGLLIFLTLAGVSLQSLRPKKKDIFAGTDLDNVKKLRVKDVS